MKILLHGSTNNGSIGTSNYGDFIYGQQIYEYFSKKGHEVSFYRPSVFLKNMCITERKTASDSRTLIYPSIFPAGISERGLSLRRRSTLRISAGLCSPA